MKILVPIDGSEPSANALSVGIEMARAFDATLDVVHVTDQETEATEDIVETATERLREAGFDDDVEILFDDDADALGASTAVGKDILQLIDERGYDHVVMGSHGGGCVEELFVGSASETVLDEATIPVTVVP